MKQFANIAETKAAIGSLIYEGMTIGFVPTMGALHDGHLTLIRRAKLENDMVVCSIFVNPTQFNNKDDLFKYPRNIANDARMLEANGCGILFAPEVAEMYPNGEKELLNLKFGKLDKVMEGKFRPGHFQGVATIVNKLFEIVKPVKAYFGKKDFQQLAIIREMVKQLNSKVEIVGCETVREPDGFAMSSRNMQLTIAERQLAPIIFKVLQQVKQKAGVRPVKDLKSWAIRQFGQHPELRVEYFEICHRDSLMPLDNWRSKDQAVALVAVFIGDVRLIDNLELFS
ncbi:MAG: pantoate--beta-alanine ligase [Bacteroidetes bacterium]|nr:pantoate--beta-alanine ligase [Bacteroidota bacterium]